MRYEHSPDSTRSSSIADLTSRRFSCHCRILVTQSMKVVSGACVHALLRRGPDPVHGRFRGDRLSCTENSLSIEYTSPPQFPMAFRVFCCLQKKSVLFFRFVEYRWRETYQSVAFDTRLLNLHDDIVSGLQTLANVGLLGRADVHLHAGLPKMIIESGISNAIR